MDIFIQTIFLNHSILSPLITTLLTPDFILERVLDFSKSNDIYK